MNTLSQTRKKISCALKLIVIISAAAGTLLSAGAGRHSFMGGSRVFMYFTIQSNIATALICAAGFCFLLRKKPVASVWYVVKLTGTVSILLTGAVFAAMLAPTLAGKAWSPQNVLTHAVVPAAAAADFFVTVSGVRIPRKHVLWVLLPPMLYALYAGIGYVRGWEFARGRNYPYFFLNWGSPAGAFGFTDRLPYMGCAWWLLVLMVFLLLVGWGCLAAADRIGGNRPKGSR